MVTVGLLVTLQARPGKEDELAGFLASALPLAQAEPETTAWFGRWPRSWSAAQLGPPCRDLGRAGDL